MPPEYAGHRIPRRAYGFRDLPERLPGFEPPTNALDGFKGDMALVKAALTSQSALLSVLVQDVREIRARLAPRDQP